MSLRPVFTDRSSYLCKNVGFHLDKLFATELFYHSYCSIMEFELLIYKTCILLEIIDTFSKLMELISFINMNTHVIVFIRSVSLRHFH